MVLRTILYYPDARLRTLAESVIHFDATLRELAADLVETMRAAPGIGITAPHIGVFLRLVAIELPEAPEPRFYVNPAVVEASPETSRAMEGSVSMPGVSEGVERPASVTVWYQGLDGMEHSETAEGLLAVCLQHEIDQLNGVFWIDRISRLRRERVIKRYEKLGRR